MKLGWYILFVIGLISCHHMSDNMESYLETGISQELASYRKATYLDVRYNLSFVIPHDKSEAVTGIADIIWDQTQPGPLIIDFRADSSQITSVSMNGKHVDYMFTNEHLYIKDSNTESGKNEISIAFRASDQSLNRRDEFLYTLLVPDRSRTLFPCFDQPDIKAHYSLKLEVPVEWVAISNGKIEAEDSLSFPGRKTVTFKETEPLPTYLFSFVAGKLKREIYTTQERSISIYHRETDPQKAKQCPEIAKQVMDALSWMEDYTGIPYPFAKYDLIIIPGFQFGGMEHTGATLYNAGSMFLNEQSTLDEKLRRSSLIAHETAHMWFGDLVTMKWFDDVWTKEVFANYFAARIVEPAYPDINHRLNFIKGYVPPAYSEDRTSGSTPIKQELDNLRNAGLAYSNIVYDKSPVMMEMLIQIIGDDAYKKGLHDYLKTFGYANATWEQLISILSKYTDKNIVNWSHVWVNENGMPTVKAYISGDSLLVDCSDPFRKGRIWPQRLNYIICNNAGEYTNIFIEDTARHITVALPEHIGNPTFVLPNADGRGYGFFQMSPDDIHGAFAIMDTTRNDLLKGTLLISLYENLQNKVISAEEYQKLMLNYIKHEQNDLLFSMALGYVGSSTRFSHGGNDMLEKSLWNIVEHAVKPQFRIQAFRLYSSLADSPEASKRILDIWENRQTPGGCILSEQDYINISYRLAIQFPEKAGMIVAKQLDRISNPDRKAEYRFISPAVSPEKQVRDSVFNALLDTKNRRIEPWASSALSLLNHRLREKESIEYIRPALDILEEVQRTGDIFFPTAWLRALLGGHSSADAKQEVDAFWAEHPDYPKMLSSKIKQQSDHLYRLNP